MMTVDSSKLKKGQKLTVNIQKINDRVPEKLIKKLSKVPNGILVGYKMVDGNQFGLVLKLDIGCIEWFFEDELDIAILESD